MEDLKKVINYNTYRIDINEDINKLNLTKKQKQRVEEIKKLHEDILKYTMFLLSELATQK